MNQEIVSREYTEMPVQRWGGWLTRPWSWRAIDQRWIWVSALVAALLTADAMAYCLSHLSLREASVHSAVLNVMIWSAFLALAAWKHPRSARLYLLLLTAATAVGSLVALPIALDTLPQWQMLAVITMVVMSNVVSAWVLLNSLNLKRLWRRRRAEARA